MLIRKALNCFMKTLAAEGDFAISNHHKYLIQVFLIHLNINMDGMGVQTLEIVLLLQCENRF